MVFLRPQPIPRVSPSSFEKAKEFLFRGDVENYFGQLTGQEADYKSMERVFQRLTGLVHKAFDLNSGSGTTSSVSVIARGSFASRTALAGHEDLDVDIIIPDSFKPTTLKDPLREALGTDETNENILFEKDKLKKVLVALWSQIKEHEAGWLNLDKEVEKITRSIPLRVASRHETLRKALGEEAVQVTGEKFGIPIDLFLKVRTKVRGQDVIICLDKDSPAGIQRYQTTTFAPTEGLWLGDRKLSPVERTAILSLKWWKNEIKENKRNKSFVIKNRKNLLPGSPDSFSASEVQIKSHHFLVALNAMHELDTSDDLYIPRHVSQPFTMKRLLEVMGKILTFLDRAYHPATTTTVWPWPGVELNYDYLFPLSSFEPMDMLYIQASADWDKFQYLLEADVIHTFSQEIQDALEKMSHHTIFREIHEAVGKPPIFVLDNYPVVPAIVIVCSHEVAEQISRSSSVLPYGARKSSSLNHIVDLIGPNSILLKQVRKRFNPGFAPQHLMTLLPVILEKVGKYLEILDQLARSGEEFSLDDYTTNLTFDIIGAVTMDEDMDAQQIDPGMRGELIQKYKELIKELAFWCIAFADDKLQLPWWLNPRAHVRRRQLGNFITEQLRNIVRRNFERPNLACGKGKSRSVLSLGLQDVQALTPEIVDETCDQLKTFLFAGHDTTSTTVAWTVYELSRTPHALQAVRDELDKLFGRGVARDPAAGGYNVDGNWLYLNHHVIQRDPAVYGDTAERFVPERWLSAESFPPGGWRPFERGPRNCIGQELANIEARVIVAMLAYRYSFEKVGLGELDPGAGGQPALDDQGQVTVKSTLYTTIQISSKPVDGMRMKIHIANDYSQED
ncbi:hypothetical protein N3K66_007257 [Trichothecium roseum]|uniref:Uncharacterized protein n=1 Tax=Trichothecium roseum TaxID=47278 RepID=A0ACC0UTG7_9HYPO|nr:hypothetical protein N3K66_007257 [Trichothecium roseum]